MTGGTALELTCPKWNKPVAEATCNICKDQCNNSVADPDNFIAKKLIVDLEKVKGNRLKLHLLNKPIIKLSDTKTEPEPTKPAEPTKPTQVPEPTKAPEPGDEPDEAELLEQEMNNMDFLKEEIEETFKDRADMIIDSLGLGHMKAKDDENDEEKEET